MQQPIYLVLSRPLITLYLAFILVGTSFGQTSSSVAGALQKFLRTAADNRAESSNLSVLYHPNNAAAVLQSLAPYYQDTLYNIRVKAFGLAATIGSKASNPTIRNQAVNALLQGCNDPESGVVGACSKALQQFSPIDFDEKAMRRLGTLLIPNKTYLNQLAQLAGFVGQPEYEGTLQNLLLQPKLSKKDKWAVQLALARMGNPEMLSRVVARVKSVPVNDDMVYEAAPALVYVRQPASMAYLFEIMMSDNRNCESANPDSDEKILCAYRVLESIAPVIKDFPLKLDESGDLDVKDYPAALQTARSWYNGHQNSYSLIKDTF